MVRTRQSAQLEDQTKKTTTKDEKPTQSKLLSLHELDTERLTEEIFSRMKGTNHSGGSVEDTDSEALPDMIELGSVEPTIQHRECPTELASSLQPCLDETPYFNYGSVQTKDTGSGRVLQTEVDSLLKKSVITPDFEKKECAPPINGRHALEKAKKVIAVARLQSSGKGWFDMPAPQLTPELKNDLKLLRMRNALDPGRHYKANDSKQLPRYFQVGRVVSDASEFYSSRIPRRQQKQSLVEELLSNEEVRDYHKKKYLELQAKFKSGTKRLKKIKHKKSMRT